MSATRDKSQKITFIYKNFHDLYRKGRDAAIQSPGLTMAKVLKVEDLNAPTFAAFNAPELIGKRLEAVAALSARSMPAQAPAPIPAPAVRSVPSVMPAPAIVPSTAANPAIESLKQNLKELNDLHSRLKFMLQELEELSRDERE